MSEWRIIWDAHLHGDCHLFACNDTATGKPYPNATKIRALTIPKTAQSVKRRHFDYKGEQIVYKCVQSFVSQHSPWKVCHWLQFVIDEQLWCHHNETCPKQIPRRSTSVRRLSVTGRARSPSRDRVISGGEGGPQLEGGPSTRMKTYAHDDPLTASSGLKRKTTHQMWEEIRRSCLEPTSTTPSVQRTWVSTPRIRPKVEREATTDTWTLTAKQNISKCYQLSCNFVDDTFLWNDWSVLHFRWHVPCRIVLC